MFFDEGEDRAALRFAAGSEVCQAVEGATGLIECYLTTEAADFLLCLTHHEDLIAVGGAARWLKERQQRAVERRANLYFLDDGD